MDKALFETAKEMAAGRTYAEEKKIGVLGEKTLHRTLKYYFEPFEENHEVKIAGYFADIVGENGIFEIQTASFNKLKKKLSEFLTVCPVTVVYPIALKRKVIVINENGEHIKSFVSPKRGSMYNLFDEIFRIKELLTHENLTLCLALFNGTEYRTTDKKRKGRKPYEKLDTIPEELIDEIYFRNAADYKIFLPEGLQDGFTSQDVSLGMKIPRHRAQEVLNLLNHIGTVQRTGKSGNSYKYKMVY